MTRPFAWHLLSSGAIIIGVWGPLVSDASAAPPAFASAVSNSNPALWYRLNETSGNAANSGSLGAGFNGVVSASVTRSVATAAGDTGMRFTSANDFIESLAASALTGNPTFTIEAIVNLDGTGGANYGPLLHWGGAATGAAVYFSISFNSNNRIYTGFYNAGLRTAPIDTGVWHHLVWVRQGGNDTETGSTVYIDGCLAATERDPILNPGFVAAPGINIQGTTFRINRAADFIGNRRFTGTLDEVALYPRALSAAEIAQHAAASGLVCYANCDCSATSPALSPADFSCFLAKYRAGDPYANCDNSTTPVLSPADFTCFLTRYRAGCP
jgi:large repetitive protein